MTKGQKAVGFSACALIGALYGVAMIFSGVEIKASDNGKLKPPPSMIIYSKEKHYNKEWLIVIDSQTDARYLVVSGSRSVAIIELKPVKEKIK